jgi:hypothetical protein
MHQDKTTMRTLQVDDRIELSGGYDYDPIFLKTPPANKRTGKIIQFIKGQNEASAAVAKLDEIITGQTVTGDIVVLELRHQGATWTDTDYTVHIELCDFLPDNKPWKDRKQGEWVEGAATLRKA